MLENDKSHYQEHERHASSEAMPLDAPQTSNASTCLGEATAFLVTVTRNAEYEDLRRDGREAPFRIAYGIGMACRAFRRAEHAL